MRSFYVRKLQAQLFCAYILGLYFTGARLLAQKLHVEHWWNWAQVSFGYGLETKSLPYEKQNGDPFLVEKIMYTLAQIFEIGLWSMSQNVTSVLL